ncbi:GGDEF domain-containing protein [Thalassotalea atypica]|uniref:GGDEF domain-containing protein n=1 Tax=Thalassotalea atypica TaxID=2054316 RepID=UPI00257473E3|nr:diguanylate cyclase [Thalassotalea atypica]
MNKSALTLRLAIVVIFAALSVGLIVSQIFLKLTYVDEYESSKVKISQLYKTVSSTVSIATYLNDQELIREVIAGLTSNDIVQSVSISTEKVYEASENYKETEFSQTFLLYSPFEQEREVGKLIITPNIEFIELRALHISRDNQLAILIQAAIITLAVIIISIVVVARPITTIARTLHEIKPGTDARVPLPEYHQKSEVGLLVKDINGLLERSSKQIVKERSLRKQVEQLSHHFKLLFENANSPIVLTEPNGNIVLYNKAFIELLERIDITLQQGFGPYLKNLFEEPQQLVALVEEAFGNEEFASGEFKLGGNTKHSLWVQVIMNVAVTDDFYEYHQITLHDISLRRQQVEQLNIKANTDALTLLFNRRGCEKQIEKLIGLNAPFAILLLDLNKFKQINDVYGHEAGDKVLVYVSSQLKKSLRKNDILARWGGDEFVVVLPKVNADETMDICNKIIVKITKPYFLSDENINVAVGTSIGISFFPEDKTTLSSLVKAADKAMYTIKEKQNENLSIAFYRDIIESS